jgi:hypothetical protein
MAHVEIAELTAVEMAAASPRRRSRLGSWLAQIERILGILVEIRAAILVVAEIVVPFAGVVSRIGRVDPAQGIRPIRGYMLALLVGLAIVAIFAWISIGFL